jgi:arginyl-tRNA--protein-N-Asp/Glu arginylyltransferase
VSVERAPRVIPPPRELRQVGPLVVVDGDCAYFHDGRSATTAFALPGNLTGADYQRAMDLGMRRSGTVVYRPLCDGCRRCQPLRVPVVGYQPTKSQRRVKKRADGLFRVDVGRPKITREHLSLYARYQADQHGEHAQAADEKSYRRFLIETVTETIELTWRDKAGKLIGVGILDVTPTAVSSVYFYWEPMHRKLSLGVYSALTEIELARMWGKTHYYLGFLVAGSSTMSYKADFPGAELWDGADWVRLPTRVLDDEDTKAVLAAAEQRATGLDGHRFRLSSARVLPVANDG